MYDCNFTGHSMSNGIGREKTNIAEIEICKARRKHKVIFTRRVAR